MHELFFLESAETTNCSHDRSFQNEIQDFRKLYKIQSITVSPSTFNLMIRKITTLALCFITTVSAYSQTNAFIHQLNGKRIPSASVSLLLQTIVDTAKIDGLSVVIINKGKVVYSKCFGIANKEKDLPLNDSTVMYAASLTKPVSAFLFLKLAEANIFHLDTPIFRYLKKPLAEYEKWKDITSSPDHIKITPRMLLSHCSGLPILRYLYNDKLDLIAEPGRKFYYSNEGMNLLGFMIEEYMGRSLNGLAEAHVFKPFHMPNTSMIWETRFESNYAVGYDKEHRSLGMDKRPVPKAAGSMSTTALDYANFVTALLNKKALGKSYLSQMLSSQIRIWTNRGFGPQKDSITEKFQQIELSWGLGVGLYQSKFGKAFFHTGHSDGWQNYFVAYPKGKTAIILMSNSSNFERMAGQILAICLAENTAPSNLEWLNYYD